MEQFIKEIQSSGYNFKEAREIIMSSIRGWKRRGREKERDSPCFYHCSIERKKLVEKANWYKTNRDNLEEEEESPRKKSSKGIRIGSGREQRISVTRMRGNRSQFRA